MHYDATAQQLTVEDPQFIFFIRKIAWKRFAQDLGFVGLDFKNRYDFALSFAGEDRSIAEEIFSQLQDAESEVFYDKNEQHRILAVDIDEYLRPIYQSEARFVVALLSQNYPKKIWTKIESDHFKDRLKTGDVVPVWFSDAPLGIFDETRKIGGLAFDVASPRPQEVGRLVNILLKRLADSRQPEVSAQIGLPNVPFTA